MIHPDRITWIRLISHPYENVRLTQMKDSLRLGREGRKGVRESYVLVSLTRILVQMGELDLAKRFMYLARERYKQEDDPEVMFNSLYEGVRVCIDTSCLSLENLTMPELTDQLEQVSMLPGMPPPFQIAFQHLQSVLGSLSSTPERPNADRFEPLLSLIPEVMQLLGPYSAIFPGSTQAIVVAHRYASEGNYERASQIYEKLLKEQKEIGGTDHPQYGSLLLVLALNAASMHDEEKIIDYNMQLLTIRDPAPSSDDSLHLHANTALAQLYQQRKEPEVALQFFENIINLSRLPPKNW